MSSTRWSEVERLFWSALERPEGDREAFVRVEADDPRILEEVLALLDSHSKPGLLDGLVSRLDALEEEHPGEGVRLGAWEVTGEVGRGGMGIVYRARRADGQYEQEAALKVLSRVAPGSQSLDRFLAERQILARLDHPNIARLLDGGITEGGRPFYVMELVDGVPIDRYCDDRRLGVAARLRLFTKVCEAVQSAHRSLVVHRDLKPANILVTTDGEPKLLDFGIAKLLDADGPGAGHVATRVTARVLTPEYASPEQLEGRTVTTASDVYQLGVLLYELLVGHRPYPASAASPDRIGEALATLLAVRPSAAVSANAEASIADQEGAPGVEERAAARATTPGRLSRRLRGDLDDIVLKAMRPEPDRRYGSAGQLGEDIVRHLDGLPVRARPDTVAYRARKFVGRHRLGVAATTGAFLLLGGFSVGLQQQGQRVAAERDRAEEVLDFMVEAFGNANPYVSGGDTVTVREVLARGAERARADLSGRPMVQVTLLEALGKIYVDVGRADSAATLYEEAVAVRRRSLDGDQHGLAASLAQLATSRISKGDNGEAPGLLEEALVLFRAGPDRGDRGYAETLNDIGNGWQLPGQWDRAAPLLEEALGAHERSPEPTSAMAMTLNNLGWIQMSRAAPDSAARLFRRSAEIRRRIGGPDAPALDRSLESLAGALIRLDSLEAADRVVTEAMRIRRGFLSSDHPLMVSLVSVRADVLRRQGRFEEAETLYRAVLADRTAALGPDHVGVAYASNDLGLLLREQGRGAEALPLFREAWTVFRSVVGDDHVSTTIAEANLARLLYAMGDTRAALERFEHAVPILRGAYPDDPRYLEDQVSLGSLRCLAGMPDGGLGELESAVAGLQPPEGEPSTNAHLRALNATGGCLAGQGRIDEAREMFRHALAASSDRSNDDPHRAYALRALEQLR